MASHFDQYAWLGSSTLSTNTIRTSSSTAVFIAPDNDSVQSDAASHQQSARKTPTGSSRRGDRRAPLHKRSSYVPDKRVSQISVAGAGSWWSRLIQSIQQSWPVRYAMRPLLVLVFLYLFICSLDLLSSAFQLLGGKAAGRVFQQNEYLQNPVCGLMIGVLSTVLVQSSSTSTSIVVTMVANGLLTVPLAIPIIFGANIGTSVTNTIVSLAQGSNREEFRRAFAGATVHDAFNWLTVLVMLPLEVCTHFLYNTTKSIVDSIHPQQQQQSTVPTTTDHYVSANNITKSSTTKKSDGGGGHGGFNLLGVITKPLTSSIIQLDKKVIEAVATGDADSANRSLIKLWCSSYRKVAEPVFSAVPNNTDAPDDNKLLHASSTVHAGDTPCVYLMRYISTSETVVGIILLIASLVMLVGCLMCVVKVLNAMLKGSVAKTIQKYVNEDLPAPFAYFTNWVALVVGAIITVLLQSSSVFTSTLTPLVGIGMVSLERMYPLTLGSNVGTCGTGLLAALSSGESVAKLKPALHIALCHLFFNLSGTALFFPLPFMRFPMTIARLLGNTTAKYKWFACFYIVLMFFALPLFVFILSLNMHLFYWIGGPLLVGFLLVVFINVLQRKVPNMLPSVLQTWTFLPHFMHSLKPIDCILRRIFACCPQSCLEVCCESVPSDDDDAEDHYAVTNNGHNAVSSPSHSSATTQSLLNKNVILEDGDDGSSDAGGGGGIIMRSSTTTNTPPATTNNSTNLQVVNEKLSSTKKNASRFSRSHDVYNIKREGSGIYRPVSSREPSTDRDSTTVAANNNTSNINNSNRKARKTRRTLNLLRTARQQQQNDHANDTAELQRLSTTESDRFSINKNNSKEAARDATTMQESSFTSAASSTSPVPPPAAAAVPRPPRTRAKAAVLNEDVLLNGPSTRSIAAMVSATIKHNQEPLKSSKQQHYGGPLRHSFVIGAAVPNKKLPENDNEKKTSSNKTSHPPLPSDTESRRKLLLTSAGSSAATSYASIAEFYANINNNATSNNNMWPAGSTTLTSASSSPASSQVPSRAPSRQRFSVGGGSPTLTTAAAAAAAAAANITSAAAASPTAATTTPAALVATCSLPDDDVDFVLGGSMTLSNKSNTSSSTNSNNNNGSITSSSAQQQQQQQHQQNLVEPNANIIPVISIPTTPSPRPTKTSTGRNITVQRVLLPDHGSSSSGSKSVPSAPLGAESVTTGTSLSSNVETNPGVSNPQMPDGDAAVEDVVVTSAPAAHDSGLVLNGDEQSLNLSRI